MNDIEKYHAAIESGDIAEAVRLARLIDWVAIAPPTQETLIDHTGYENSLRTSPMSRRVESAILRRDERFTMDY